MYYLVGRLYSIYAALIFTALFLLVFPFQLIFSFDLRTHRLALWFNKLWAWGFFALVFMPVIIQGRKHIPNGQFIYCSNHFSYLDIPALGLLGGAFKFFGKMSISKIPLFGWMYKRLHVTVDRSSFKSRAHALSMARQMLQSGYNMAFFPEGGVRLKNYPEMAPFRDGAFRLAVELQLPIVPVVMPRNQEAWPYDPRQLFFGGWSSIYILPPVFPHSHSEEEITRLKQEVREKMQECLDEHAVRKAVNIAVS